jgi:hypothetical protein
MRQDRHQTQHRTRVRIRRPARPLAVRELDLRTPSGRVLPF